MFSNEMKLAEGKKNSMAPALIFYCVVNERDKCVEANQLCS
jgi:hypothetical protein